MVDRAWIRKNILGLTDEDIERIIEGKKADKLEDKEVEAAGSETAAPAGGDAGGTETPPAGGEEPAGSEEAGGEEGGGGLFSGEFIPGTVMNEDDELEEEEKIDEYDGGLPIMPEAESKRNVFGGKISGRKKRMSSNAKASIPDFLTMTLDKRSQSTSKNPYGDKSAILGSGMNETPIGTSLTKALFEDDATTRPRRTPEMSSALRNLSLKMNKEPLTSLLSEADDIFTKVDE
jgi:hypothetical protein